MNFSNGDLYVGEYSLGSKEGKGSLKYIKGDEYEGDFKDCIFAPILITQSHLS